MWVASLFYTGQSRTLLMSFVASYGAAVIVAELFHAYKKRNVHTEFKEVKLSDENITPELKEKMTEVFKLLESIENVEVKQEKCSDPHCKNCWGLAD